MVIQKKAVPLHPQIRILGYGVMVTLQILVLPFLVRVRVPQPKVIAKLSILTTWRYFFFVNITVGYSKLMLRSRILMLISKILTIRIIPINVVTLSNLVASMEFHF